MKTLAKILTMKDGELGAYLITTLKKYYPKVITDKDNYIYAKGPGEICLVAHIDTVRSKKDEPVMLSQNRNVITNVKGVLGADDRAGVYGILEVIKTLHDAGKNLPPVIFTNYEESGGGGVRKFVASKHFDSTNVKLMVELDRRGCNEYVFYSWTLPKKVADYIESFGFHKENGSFSDISVLTDEYCIPSVNLSIGYYSQHTSMERLHYDEMLMTIDRVISMCCDPIAKLHPVEKRTYNYKNYNDNDYGYGSYYHGHTSVNSKQGGTTGTTGGAAGKTGAQTQPIDLAPKDKDKDTNANLPATTGSSVTPAEQQELFNKKSKEDAFSVLINNKDVIKTALIHEFSLDSVCQQYFEHPSRLEIISVLAEIDEFFSSKIMLGVDAQVAFNLAWSDMVTTQFYKLNPGKTPRLSAVH